MDIASKVAGLLLTVFGAAALVFGIVLTRWLYLNTRVQKLRDEITYYCKEVERKDKELVKIREDFERLKGAQHRLEGRVDGDHEEMVRKDAMLYAQEDYIRRLEAGYRARGEKLPRRPDKRVSWEDEGQW